MADAGKRQISAKYEDFVLLQRLIRAGEEDRVIGLIDSKDFSKEAYHKIFWLSIPLHAPLTDAVTFGCPGVVRCLLERGLDYLRYGEGRGAPVVHAVKSGQLEIVRALVEEFGYELPNNACIQKENLLTSVVLWGNKKLLEYLLDVGTDINYVGSEGTVLHLVVAIDKLDMCELVLSRGFTQIDARNARGETAFFRVFMSGRDGVFRSGSWSICDALVARGADVNLGSHNHPNVFSRATCVYDLNTVKRLHGYGADPDMDRGERPIESAVRTNKYTTVHYLAVVLNVPLTGVNILESLTQCLTMVPQCSVPQYKLSDHLSTKILLLKAGYHIGSEVFDSLSSDVTKLSPGEASKYMNQVLSHPQSLADICCFRIRRVLDKSLPERVDRLPLPTKLIDFVKLTHVEPVEYTDSLLDTDVDEENLSYDQQYYEYSSSSEEYDYGDYDYGDYDYDD